MLGIFFIMSLFISLLIFFVNNRSLTIILTSLFLALEISISIFAALNIDKIDTVYYKFDALGVLLTLVLSVLSIATFYHSRLYLIRHDFTKKQESTYYAALIMLITAMISAYFAENIALLWVSIEATTLFVSLLIFHERSRDAIEASWKYLFISSVGVAIAFMGILFLSIVATKGGLSDLSLHNLLSITKQMDSNWLKIAFLLVLTGFSAKMGLFPLHTVAVDAHTAAPFPISAFISTTLMNVGFVGIFRIFTIISQTEVLHWAQNVLLIAGILSITMAAIQLLRIKHLKRMFAFSSLEHMGIVAIGLAVGGIGYYAAILQIVFHSFSKASLFYQVGQIHSVFKSYMIKDVGGYFKINPVGGYVMLFAFISITAMPPSGLFISEFLILKAMFTGNQIVLAILIPLLLTVVIYVFGKHLLQLLYTPLPAELEPKVYKLNPYETISQFILLGLVVYLGISPPAFFTDLVQQAIAILN
jgi:hydrogenase-4 component F